MLLTEYLPFKYNQQSINESINNNGKLIVTGVLQRANAKNHNGSLYEKLEKAKRDTSPDGRATVDALNIRIRQETAKVVTDALEKQLEFNIN